MTPTEPDVSLAAADTADPGDTANTAQTPALDTPARPSWWRLTLLVVAAMVFLFPFYYMIIGSLQKKQNTSLSRGGCGRHGCIGAGELRTMKPPPQ